MSKKFSPYLILGPATVVSVAYIDPGNFGSNIKAGTVYGLELLWVVWLAGIMAILFQYISGKLGIVTKRAIPDFVFEKTSNKLIRFLYFLIFFIMILATDMAEFLGITLGLHLIFGIPLLIAVWISIIDVLILMFAADKVKAFEVIIGSLVAIVGISYILELHIINVNTYEIIYNSFNVNIKDYGQIILASSIIGATVMPHAVLLHSYLALEKWSNVSEIKNVIKRHLKETIIYLSIASFINASIQILSFYAFYKNGYNNVDMDIAFFTLIPLYGINAALIFAIALLASGISSSMVSVLAGQKVIESFMKKKFVAWKTRLFVRLINMLPLFIAIYLGIKTIDILVYSQVVLSLTLPFILFPLIIISSSKKIMGNYKLSPLVFLISFTFSLIITLINLSLIFLGII